MSSLGVQVYITERMYSVWKGGEAFELNCYYTTVSADRKNNQGRLRRRQERRQDRKVEHTDGRTDGQTDEQTDRQTEGQTGRQTDRHAETDRQTDTQADRQTDRQTDRQADVHVKQVTTDIILIFTIVGYHPTSLI